MIQGTLYFFDRTVNGLINGLRLMRGRNRLVTFQARFHHSALVMAPGFVAVLVAQMNFDAGNMVCQMTQGVLHGGFGLLRHRFATFDVMIGIHLDFHDFS